MKPPRNKRPNLPIYACCAECGERRPDALRRKLVGGQMKCLNCTAPPSWKAWGSCPCCRRQNEPLQEHHIFGRKLQEILCGTDAKTGIVAICFNCHAEISDYLLPLMDWQASVLNDRDWNAILMFVNMLAANAIWLFRREFSPQLRQKVADTIYH